MNKKKQKERENKEKKTRVESVWSYVGHIIALSLQQLLHNTPEIL
jgi:hypothetical protein